MSQIIHTTGNFIIKTQIPNETSAFDFVEVVQPYDIVLSPAGTGGIDGKVVINGSLFVKDHIQRKICGLKIILLF